MTSHCQVLPASGSDPVSGDYVSHCKSAGRRRGRTKPRGGMESISIPFIVFFMALIHCNWAGGATNFFFHSGFFGRRPAAEPVQRPPRAGGTSEGTLLLIRGTWLELCSFHNSF